MLSYTVYINGKNAQTIDVVVFKLDIYAVYAVVSTQIYLPPHDMVRKTSSNTYCACLHAGCCVSVNCSTSIVIVVRMWLGRNFVVGYIIYRWKNIKSILYKLRRKIIQFNFWYQWQKTKNIPYADAVSNPLTQKIQ